MGIFSHRLLAGMAIGALAAVPAVSSADSIAELQFDVNSATIKAVYQNGTSGFGGVSHTGYLQFGTDADSEVGLQLNGSPQSSVFSGRLVGFSGRIDFVGGVSQEPTGFIRLIVENFEDSSTDEYSFKIAAGAELYGPVGRSSYRPLGFQLYADTFGGTFVDGNNDGTFGGVDIGDFKGQPALNGVFFQLKYNPNSVTGYSGEVDVEIITTAPLLPDPSTGTPVVPTPAAALSGFGLLGLLGAAQWYRSSRRNAAGE